MAKYKYNLNKADISILEKQENNDDIAIRKIILKTWINRKFILMCTSVFVLMGAFVAIAFPVSYTANCTVVPQTGNKRGGDNLGGLASMVGINLGSSITSETLSPYVYPQIINSVPFCKDIMETPIVVEKSDGNTISLYEYYTDKKYQSVNIIGNIKKYTIGLPATLISALKNNNKQTTVVSDSVNGGVIRLTEKEEQVIKIIRNSIQFESNDKEGYVKLGFFFSEPLATAVIAQNVYETLEEYVTNYKSQKQQDNLEFVKESYESARDDFIKKQDALATFQDANRNLTSAMARATERSLSSDYDVAYTVYNELARQLEQAKISVNESTPILTVIDPVVVPNQKAAPKRAVILIAFMFLGFTFSIGWVFAKPFFKRALRELKKESNLEEY